MIPSNQASSGFQRTPVCKVLFGSAIGSSLIVNLPLKHYQGFFTYTHTDIFDKCQLWRIFTAKLVYLDFKDLFICSVLLYYFRIFEKRFGSRKFCSYLLGTGALATCLELLAVFVCRKWDLNLGPLPSGLLCFIYPLFIPFYCDIPRVPLSHIFGIPMTGKSMSYILGLQAASSSPESILVCVCGLLAGLLWRVNFLKLPSIVQIPQFLSRMFDSTIGRLCGSSPPVEENRFPMGATLELQRQETVERLEAQQLRQWTTQMMSNGHIGRPQPQNLVNGPGLFGNNNREGLRQRYSVEVEEEDEPVMVEEASEEQIQRLVEMGFEESAVRNALMMSNNDVSMATNFLLQQT